VVLASVPPAMLTQGFAELGEGTGRAPPHSS
jgi:hypothetical protein